MNGRMIEGLEVVEYDVGAGADAGGRAATRRIRDTGVPKEERVRLLGAELLETWKLFKIAQGAKLKGIKCSEKILENILCSQLQQNSLSDQEKTAPILYTYVYTIYMQFIHIIMMKRANLNCSILGFTFSHVTFPFRVSLPIPNHHDGYTRSFLLILWKVLLFVLTSFERYFYYYDLYVSTYQLMSLFADCVYNLTKMSICSINAPSKS